MPRALSATSFTFSDKEMPIRMGRYNLLSRLRVDPIGEEFLAAWGVDEGIDQLRVVRCIYPRVAEEAEFIALFSEEARALSRLSSSNIARIMEVNIEGRIPFVAREYVEGLALARVFEIAHRRTALWPWELAAHVVAEMLRGLDYVHRREDIHGNPMGMRHGDVRPDNVLVSFGGEVKLVNFGSMLRFIADEATHARLGRMRDAFLPPEGEPDGAPTVEADLWACGLTLVLLLGGGVPSARGAEWSPPMMSMRVEDLPGEVDSFIARALNPDPEYRFRTAAAMRSALVDIMADHAKGHPPDDLSDWIRRLGAEDQERDHHLIRDMLAKPPSMSLPDTAGSATTLGPGYVIDDRYHLLRELGEGGMGTVFEAEHLGLGKRVAVKVLHERVMSDASTVERFRREARIIGNIGHPNIVGAIDFGVSSDGHYFMAMDLLEGRSMHHHIHEGNLSCGEIADIMARVCDGLHAAHLAGVIHRDLKPDNILLTPAGPRILDFGIAKAIGLDEKNEGLTRTGHICGTVDYIAPEQIRGASEDPRSDIYAVGVVIYEALTGHTPFHGRTVGEAMHKAIHDKLVPPSKRSGRRDIPSQLEAICIRALNRKVEKRYATAAEMAADLHALAARLGAGLPVTRANGPAPTASSTAGFIQAVKGGRRRVAWMAAGAVLVVAGIFFMAWQRGGTSPEPVADDKALVVPVSVAPIPAVRGEVVAQAPTPAADPESVVQVIAPPPEDVAIAPAASSDPDPRELEKLESAMLAVEFNDKGWAHLKARRYEEAVAAFKEALRHNHRESAASFGLGKALFGQGDYSEAILAVEQSLRHSPADQLRERRIFMGILYRAAGKTDKAVEQWKKVLAVHPDDGDAKKHLAAAGVAVD